MNDDHVMAMDEEKATGKGMDHAIAEKPAWHKNIMTMEDVSGCLKDDFMDEIEDCKKYCHMAKIAENAGDEYDYYYLMEMAKDEYTHACFIHDFMERHGMHIHDEHEEHYCRLKEKMQGFFQ